MQPGDLQQESETGNWKSESGRRKAGGQTDALQIFHSSTKNAALRGAAFLIFTGQRFAGWRRLPRLSLS